MSMRYAGCSLFLTLLCGLPAAVEASRLSILAPDLPGQSEAGGQGRDSAIVSAVLERCGYQPDFRVVPFGRHVRSFADYDGSDAVMTVATDLELPGYRSRTYVWYQNGASMLESNTEKAYRIEHLAGLRVVAFANARKILDIEKFVDRFGEYLELANQRLHSTMLYFGRVDVVVSDGLIFSEINKRLANDPQFSKRVDMSEPILFTPIFDPEPFHMVFRDREVRDEFDRCFRELEGEGVVRAINVKYVDRHRDVVGHGYLGY